MVNNKVLKGVVAYHQAALNKEFTSLKATEGVKLVLTLSRGGPEHNKMVSEVQIQRRCNKVYLIAFKYRGSFSIQKRSGCGE